jgi:adenine-specific DNA-methyltransferase
MDYADTITAERVRRVMTGYGEGSKRVEELGGAFDYYELGERLFHGEYLNENVGLPSIRQYLTYSENIPSKYRIDQSLVSPYLLGICPDTSWVFYYEPDRETILDVDFLATLKYRANGYTVPTHSIIYADRCVLTTEQLERFGIRFKKIPRDLTRL